jgi:hypothetical protein
MSLRDRQSLFVVLVAKLIEYGTAKGYEFTFGDAWRPDGRGHMKGSLHYVKLALDLSLFRAGKFIESSEDPAYLELGIYWESLNPGCQWGGRFGDANHYSFSDGVSNRRVGRRTINKEDRCLEHRPRPKRPRLHSSRTARSTDPPRPHS